MSDDEARHLANEDGQTIETKTMALHAHLFIHESSSKNPTTRYYAIDNGPS